MSNPQDILAEADREILLTVQEYATLFRRHPQSIYIAIRKDRLQFPVVRPSGDRMFIRVPATLVRRLKPKIA